MFCPSSQSPKSVSDVERQHNRLGREDAVSYMDLPTFAHPSLRGIRPFAAIGEPNATMSGRAREARSIDLLGVPHLCFISVIAR